MCWHYGSSDDKVVTQCPCCHGVYVMVGEQLTNSILHNTVSHKRVWYYFNRVLWANLSNEVTLSTDLALGPKMCPLDPFSKD